MDNPKDVCAVCGAEKKGFSDICKNPRCQYNPSIYIGEDNEEKLRQTEITQKQTRYLDILTQTLPSWEKNPRSEDLVEALTRFSSIEMQSQDVKHQFDALVLKVWEYSIDSRIIKLEQLLSQRLESLKIGISDLETLNGESIMLKPLKSVKTDLVKEETGLVKEVRELKLPESKLAQTLLTDRYKKYKEHLLRLDTLIQRCAKSVYPVVSVEMSVWSVLPGTLKSDSVRSTLSTDLDFDPKAFPDASGRELLFARIQNRDKLHIQLQYRNAAGLVAIERFTIENTDSEQKVFHRFGLSRKGNILKFHHWIGDDLKTYRLEPEKFPYS